MATEYYTDGQGRRQSRETKTDDDVASATVASKSTADSGMGKKGNAGKTPMPKQEQGESPAAFGARLREWRAAQTKDVDNLAQKKALRGEVQ